MQSPEAGGVAVPRRGPADEGSASVRTAASVMAASALRAVDPDDPEGLMNDLTASTDEEILRAVRSTGNLRVMCCTWNMHGEHAPSPDTWATCSRQANITLS